MTEHAGPNRDPTVPPPTLTRSSIPPPNRIAAVVLVAFAVCALVEGVVLLSNCSVLALINRMEDESANPDSVIGEVTEAEIVATERRIQTLGGVHGFAYLGTLAVFLVWIFQASKYAHSLRRTRMRITPGWAVGWWFIPIACLWMPYQAVTEIWQVSDHSRTELWRQGPIPRIFPSWWVAWLASLVLPAFASAYAAGEPTPSEAQTATQIAIGGGVAGMIAAVMALLVVRAIQQRQAAPNVVADVFD